MTGADAIEAAMVVLVLRWSANAVVSLIDSRSAMTRAGNVHLGQRRDQHVRRVVVGG